MISRFIPRIYKCQDCWLIIWFDKEFIIRRTV